MNKKWFSLCFVVFVGLICETSLFALENSELAILVSLVDEKGQDEASGNVMEALQVAAQEILKSNPTFEVHYAMGHSAESLQQELKKIQMKTNGKTISYLYINSHGVPDTIVNEAQFSIPLSCFQPCSRYEPFKGSACDCPDSSKCSDCQESNKIGAIRSLRKFCENCREDFRKSFEPLIGQLASKAHIVFTGCRLLEGGDLENKKQRAKDVFQNFGLKCGHIYANETEGFLYRDLLQQRFFRSENFFSPDRILIPQLSALFFFFGFLEEHHLNQGYWYSSCDNQEEIKPMNFYEARRMKVRK